MTPFRKQVELTCIGSVATIQLTSTIHLACFSAREETLNRILPELTGLWAFHFPRHSRVTPLRHSLTQARGWALVTQTLQLIRHITFYHIKG